MKSVLTIAGSDSSGGAGIQADIKTIAAHHLFAQSVITALTAQNTTGVRDIFDIPVSFIGEQIDAVFEDIYPDAVKIGMVSSPDIVHAIAEGLKKYGAKRIVVDPVMVATSGADLASDGVVEALRSELFPLATVITPNMPEAEVLWGAPIKSAADQEQAAVDIARLVDAAVVVKGGHGSNDANDVLAEADGTVTWFKANRVDNQNTHGTGCTFSSAIACGLALEMALHEAIAQAKSYMAGALEAQLDLGKGSGPLDHMWRLP